jgi:hypothetical protein
MKGRTWILILAVIVSSVTGLYMVLFPIFQLDNKARDYLVERISGVIGEDVDISSVSLSPGFISLKNVKLQCPDTPFIIEARSVRIGYNLIEMMKNHFQPVYGAEQIIVDKPCFVWIVNESDRSISSRHLKNFPEITLKKLPPVRITVQNGSFVCQKKDSLITIAEDIRGWLDGTYADRMELIMQARLLSSKTNASVKGQYNRSNGKSTFDISAKKCSLSRQNIDMLTGRLHIAEGSLNLQIHAEYLQNKFACTGNYRIENGSFSIKETGFNAKKTELKGRINESEIFLDSITGEMWGMEPSISGSLKLLPQPYLSLQGKADNVQLSLLLKDIYPKEKNYPLGKINAAAKISGPLTDLSLEADISAKKILYRGQTIQDVRVDLKLDPGQITIENLQSSFSGYDISGKGILTDNPVKKSMKVSFSAFVQNSSDSTKNFQVRTEGEIQQKTKSYSAQFELDRVNSHDLLSGHISGIVSLAGDIVNYSFGNSLISFTGVATNIFNDPSFDSRVKINRLSLSELYDLNEEGFIEGDGRLNGKSDLFTLSGNFRFALGKYVHSDIIGKASVAGIFTPTPILTAQAKLENFIVYNSLPMSFTISARADSLSSTALIDDDKKTAQLLVRMSKEQRDISGYLTLKDFGIERIIEIFETDDFSHRGKLTGSFQLGGTLENPKFSTNKPIQASDLHIGGFDRLSGSGYVSGRIGEIKFSDFTIKRDSKPVMHADGIWVTGKPFILTAGGKGIELGAINDIISPIRKCDGLADYNLTMGFTTDNGTIDGEFVVRNGHFLDIPFDEASGIFGGGSEGFEATDFKVYKKEVFSGTGSAFSGYFWCNKNKTPGLRMKVFMKGDLPRALPYLTPTLKSASGESRLSLIFGGTWEEPVIIDGYAEVSGGIAEPSFLVNRITDIEAKLKIDPEYKTLSGFKAVRVLSASGIVNGKKISVRNILYGSEKWNALKKPELLSVVNSTIGLEFGVFLGKIERGKYRDRSIDLHIPGFMKLKDTAQFELANEKEEFFVGAAAFEDHLTPYIGGSIKVLSGDFTYPLLIEPSISGDSPYLEEIFWDLEIRAGSSVYYFNEVNKTLAHFKYPVPIAGATVSKILAKLDEKSVCKVSGRFSDDSFRVTGDARSSSGTVNYFGVEFDVEIIELDLDTDRITKPALLSARAKTIVTNDSTGVETEIYLKVNSVDSGFVQRKEAPGRVEVPRTHIWDLVEVDARALGFLTLEFTSSNPLDDTQEKILARMGISPGNIGNVAGMAFASGVENYYFDYLLKPIETAIRKYSKLDVLRFSPSVLGNFVRSKLVSMDRFNTNMNYTLFEGSRLQVGEYFLDDFFLTYQGEYGLGRDLLRRKKRGFYHEMDLQYLLETNTRLQFIYYYDDVIRKKDRRVEIRHDFDF